MSKHLKVASHCIPSIFLYYNLYLRSGDVFDGRPWQLKRSSCLLSACCSVARQSWEGVRGRKFNSDWKYSFFIFLVCWIDWDYISVCLENSYFSGNKLWKEASNLLQWNWKRRIIDEKERKSKESNRCRGSEILIFNARTRSWIGIWGNMSSWQKLRRGGEIEIVWEGTLEQVRVREADGGECKRKKNRKAWECERLWRAEMEAERGRSQFARKSSRGRRSEIFARSQHKA